MKIVALIPYWINYEKGRKNLKLAGRHLINYTLKSLKAIDHLDEIVIYASNPEILTHIEPDLPYIFWKRPSYLDHDETAIEEIISHFLQKSDADIIVLLHPNSPFLQPNTIQSCIDAVVSGKYNSAFTACKYQKFAWFQGKPLNYSSNGRTPNIKTVEPVFLEQASLYVFSRDMLEHHSRRIGEDPFVKEINHFEGHDVNTPEDFEIAELIINSGMYKDM